MFPELEHATVDNLMSIDGRTWDVDIINEFCNERDKALIQQVPIPMRQKPDSWFWLPEAKGDFYVRSCYRLLRGEFECQERKFRRKLWSLRVPGKVQNFM